MIYSSLAKKYAHAFLNHFYQGITKDIPYEAYNDFKKALPNYKRYFFIFEMGSVAESVKLDIIDKFIAEHHLCDAEKELLLLLLKRRCFFLLPEIIGYLCQKYQSEQGLEEWTITSALKLTPSEQKKIITALEQKRVKTIIPIFRINQRLCAGFTLQSKTYFGDFSLHAFMQKITRFIGNQAS